MFDLQLAAPASGSMQYAINGTAPVTIPAMNCATQGAPISIVQTLARAGTQVTSSRFTLTIPPTSAGNLIAIGITYPPTSNCTTNVFDDAPGGGNAYVSAGASATDAATGATEIWYTANSRPGATTLTIDNCGLNPTFFLVEVSGIADTNPIEGAPGIASNQPSGPSFNAPVVTTVAPRAFVFSVLSEGAVITSQPTGNNFVQLPVTSADAASYFVAGAPGVYGAVWNWNPTGTYCASTVAFRARW